MRDGGGRLGRKRGGHVGLGGVTVEVPESGLLTLTVVVRCDGPRRRAWGL